MDKSVLRRREDASADGGCEAVGRRGWTGRRGRSGAMVRRWVGQGAAGRQTDGGWGKESGG